MSETKSTTGATPENSDKAETADKRRKPVRQPPGEKGGRDGPEPTRYGDWEVGGRCTDF